MLFHIVYKQRKLMSTKDRHWSGIKRLIWKYW